MEWGYSSVIERLPSVHVALGSIPSTITKEMSVFNQETSWDKCNKWFLHFKVSVPSRIMQSAGIICKGVLKVELGHPSGKTVLIHLKSFLNLENYSHLVCSYKFSWDKRFFLLLALDESQNFSRWWASVSIALLMCYWLDYGRFLFFLHLLMKLFKQAAVCWTLPVPNFLNKRNEVI